MAAKRTNVLVYSGPSTSLPSVRHVTWTLRRLLGPKYAIQVVSSDQVLKEPWPSTCALLVIPGGADSGYCRILNGEGNRRIKTYVNSGGNYLGLCAGGYYGTSKCEFEVGRKGWEVVGERELAFYPGICRGLALKGFVYGSEQGARAVKLKVNSGPLAGSTEGFDSYYNGGGVFVNAASLKDRGVEVLATYDEDLAVDSGEPKAAVVYCKVGEGAALLTGPHPEFAGVNLNRDETSNPNYGEIIDALLATDKQRTDFLKACLRKLGLDTSEEPQAVPSLSHLHLSSAQPGEVADMLQRWRQAGILAGETGRYVINGENDIFKVKVEGRWDFDDLKEAVAEMLSNAVKDAASAVSNTSGAENERNIQADPESADRILDYNAITKTLIPHTQSLPTAKATPHFQHAAFYSHLKHFQAKQPGLSGDYGRVILYGEVVTSTQTILEKNTTLLANLPIGTTCTATTQVSGRGRGTNVWVSPPGQLIFSTVLKHSQSLSSSAPVVFVQYLAALAVVAGIQSYDRGYDKLPIKLKWPNDIYALDPAKAGAKVDDIKSYVKIGGILVNSSYSGGDYTLILGIGLNLANAAPTTSINQLAKKAGLKELQPEKLLAATLVQFESLYARFCHSGFSKQFEDIYYHNWLHSDQVVTLETEGGAKAKIKGITTDWGLLVAEGLDFDGRLTGKRFELQSDSNSFDFLKGLLKKKV
ncbi:Biotin--protein ligase [Pseudocercospora fuligena]|uniref:Biotin--protein ligase n=1 Tax=Pseudocercospora fuligena TaxID=685502 RepID=A0A8H6VHW4_9PEZI|nr:Biotin--protein ligase [Pseudocercospora fuligena]